MNLKKHKSWLFLIVMILAYGVLALFSSNAFLTSLRLFGKIALQIIPVFILVFVLMVLSNYFVSSKFVVRHLNGRGIKKWLFVIIGGALSSGPIYMWYPLLNDLRAKGLSYGLIACFLYNRAIKIPLLPIAILYFGWQYVLILSIFMILGSVAQGWIIDSRKIQ